MDKSTVARTAAVAFATALAAALVVPSGAAADPGLRTAGGGAELAPPEMVAALERDLGLTTEQAHERLVSDFAATETEADLRASLDDTVLGGAWVEDGGLIVAITDPAAAAEVRAVGAQPRLVEHSEAALNSIMTTLDATSTPAHTEIYGWHVDVHTNDVVVHAAPGATDIAAAWVEDAGLSGEPVRIEMSTEAPETLFDIIGGYPYFPGSSRCSVGFAVQPRGFVTAGHCGGIGTSVRGFNNAVLGTVQRSNFPGADAGYVAANSNWTVRPWVYRWDNTVYTVVGSQVAPIGAATCRSGSTTGLHCGNITHRNQTVNYPQGTVTGLTRTTVCAEPGDSGGSFVASGITAQGVTSGGSGNCTFGGVTFYQPLNPMLSSYGLTLVTG